jgi:uncharacterized protein DUF4367
MSSEFEADPSELGRRLDYPVPGPELALAVGHRVRSPDARKPATTPVLRPVFRSAWQPGWRRVAVALVALVSALTGTLTFSPSARDAVARWLGLRGAGLEVVPSLPPAPSRPLGEGLFLGRQVSLAVAEASVPYGVVVPTLSELGSPDEVYVDGRIGDGIVSLVYRSRPGFPSAAQTGAALLITEFRARIDDEVIEKKLIGTGTVIESVTVDGQDGFWLEGRPHLLYFQNADGLRFEETVRLAGNVLLWERGSVTLRIEGNIGKDEAIRIAESMG